MLPYHRGDECLPAERDLLLRPARRTEIAITGHCVCGPYARTSWCRHSGADSGLEDIFEEWAISFLLVSEHSVFFSEYDRLAYSSCSHALSSLTDLELAALVSFSPDAYDRYTSSDAFQDENSLGDFDVKEAAENLLYAWLFDFASTYASEHLEDAVDLDLGR